ncbi:MAG: lysoplasmalogenase [Clostridia bacterium]|nr:lysoplasmalogenase [Clostridia bacterium]
MKKAFTITNIILILAILIGDVFYMLPPNFLWEKSITSTGFVILGISNLIYALKSGNNKKFCITMVVGLLFGLLGDVLLEINFIVGAAFFGIGHVIYILAYCFLSKLRWMDLIVSACIAIPSVLVITLVPAFNFNGIVMELVCVFYAIVISFMVGKSVSNLIKKRTLLNTLLVVGSILFFFSDLMLLLANFANMPLVVSILCLATYYPGQCILAHSIMHTQNSEHSDEVSALRGEKQ